MVHVLQTTPNLVISRCCFAEDGKEMYQELRRTCTTTVLLIKPFVKRRSRCRCRLVFLNSLVSPHNGHLSATATFLCPQADYWAGIRLYILLNFILSNRKSICKGRIAFSYSHQFNKLLNSGRIFSFVWLALHLLKFLSSNQPSPNILFPPQIARFVKICIC